MDTLDRAQVVDHNFYHCIQNQHFPIPKSQATPSTSKLNKEDYVDLFHSQLVSRHLDLLARVFKEKNQGFYTIGSSGHEGNAAIARVFRATDMAFLHYRSGAFFIQRAKQKKVDYLQDQTLSLVASAADPISGGRHKVFGSVPLTIPPQTSTIASHLPKAVGMAFAITQAKSMKQTGRVPEDSVVLCSFGDASFNHSTAQGALNAARWIGQNQLPLPIVFICEDNGIGISVPTAAHWIEQTIAHAPHLHYIACDGRNLADVTRAALLAEKVARVQRKAVFLHMQTVRLLGHAGSDIESQYLDQSQITQTELDDPILHGSRVILENQWMTADQLIALYETVKNTVHKKAEWAVKQPKLQSSTDIQSTIIPPKRQERPLPLPTEEKRLHLFGKQATSLQQPRNLCQLLNITLTDLMLQYSQTVLFGEDVGKKGGVYRVTADLQMRFGKKRVFDTLLDEQTILGTAMGLAHNGLLPIPEIQFLAYVHNAVDQLRGEAATLSFFSKGQFTNPMVLRVPSFAYQRGFGGHFHNDNAFGFLREIPGIVIACPYNGESAAKLLRACLQLAYLEQRVVIFMEPIARYMTKDLHQIGDNAFLCHYPALSEIARFDEAQCLTVGEDLAIITYGNGCYLSLQAQRRLQAEHHVEATVIDLQWLAPLPLQHLTTLLKSHRRVLIVDECRKTGSISEQLMTWMLETLTPLPKIKRRTAEDCFIPLGNAWEYILPSTEQIIEDALSLC